MSRSNGNGGASARRECCGGCWKMYDRVADFVVSRLSGMNRVERLLTGASFYDLVLGPPPCPTTIYNSAMIRRLEVFLLQGPSVALVSSSSSAAARGLLKSTNSSRSFISLSTLGNNREGEDVTNMLRDETVSGKEAARVLAERWSIRPAFLPVFEDAVTEINGAHQIRNEIRSVQATPFDDSNPRHQEMLHSLWRYLTADLPLPSGGEGTGEASVTWSEIGFQSSPGRDFRGMGLLGLQCLLYFAMHHTGRAREVLRDSKQPNQWFPFAATGLNIAAWLMDFLEDGRLNVFFFHNSRTRPLDVFNVVFSFTFLEFSRFWHLSRPKDIMQFGQVSQKFLQRISETLNSIVDPAAHSEWNLQSSTGADLTEELQCWINGEVHSKRSNVVVHAISTSRLHASV